MIRIFTIFALLASSILNVHAAKILYTPEFCTANIDICDTSTNRLDSDAVIWPLLSGLGLVHNYDWITDTDFDLSYDQARFLTTNGDQRTDQGYEMQYRPGQPSIDCITVSECWIVIKGGNQGIDRYLFNLGLWNGTDTLVFDNFWNGQGDISRVSIYSGKITMPITIDIKRNEIDPHSGGKIRVAILSDTEIPFDALQVDISTVRFGPDEAEAIRHRVKDVNKDGIPDLVLRFKIRKTGITCGNTEATLTGKTFDGLSITGTDTVKVRCKDDE